MMKEEGGKEDVVTRKPKQSEWFKFVIVDSAAFNIKVAARGERKQSEDMHTCKAQQE